MVKYATTERYIECLCGVRYAERESIKPEQLGLLSIRHECPSCHMRALVAVDTDSIGKQIVRCFYSLVQGMEQRVYKANGEYIGRTNINTRRG